MVPGLQEGGKTHEGQAMAARGRSPGFVMSDAHRVKIQNSNVLNALVEHVEGKREMSSTQVTAGIALLRKVLPDLSTVEMSGPGGGALVITISDGDAKL